ncbi:fimbrial protein [Parabacteroides sp. PF5-6]|uniref:fimbrial protein n=1 Tax=Parabacteroides sp. PF5-6 TaxID=1742403 RepID=UPI0024065B4B|nr:fimbrial protein [Parabacteroides sp. PF5-6]MDF9829894.1 hypothetical protein [Parabacteroides sp. PF5-6]
MKRIYLYMTLLAALLMTGCSNDDLGPETPTPQGDAEIALTIGVGDGLTVTSKAEGDVTNNPNLKGRDAFETKITRLTAIIFNGNKVEAAKTVENENGINAIGDIVVPVETYDIALVANGPENLETVADLDAYKAKVMSIDSQESGLVMVRYLKGVTLIAETDENGQWIRRTFNYLRENDAIHASAPSTTDINVAANPYNYGADATAEANRIVLTRLVARVDFETIKVDFTNANQFKGATFKLAKVYVVNVRPNTLLHPGETNGYESAAADDASYLYYRGAPATFVAPTDVVDHLIDPASKAHDSWNPLVKDYSAEAAGVIEIKDGDPVYDFTSTATRDQFSCYAFENSNPTTEGGYQARFVIEGQIYYADETAYETPSYYHVVLNAKAKTETEKAIGLVHNKIYRIQVTLKGLGSKVPDENPPTYADVETMIAVDSWKIIRQYEEDPDLD